jgi:hypothetical protein
MGISGVFSLKRNNGLRSELLRPLPVDCWDWTEAFALSRVPEPLRRTRYRVLAGLSWGLGRKGLRPQSPHVPNNWNIHFSSAGSTSFPV